MHVRGRGHDSLRGRPNRRRTRPTRLGENAVLVSPDAADPRGTGVLRSLSGVRHGAIRSHPSRIRPAEQVAQGETDCGLELQEQDRDYHKGAHNLRYYRTLTSENNSRKIADARCIEQWAIRLTDSRLRFQKYRDYCCPVPRSRAPRLISLGLLVLAGSVEPAWEIGHALAHLDLAANHQEAREAAPTHDRGTFPAVSALPEADGHGHPVFQAPVRPTSDLTLAVAFLHPHVFQLPLDDSPVAGLVFPGISARGSPRDAGTGQPRAPPFA